MGKSQAASFQSVVRVQEKGPATIQVITYVPADLALNLQNVAGPDVSIGELLVRIADQYHDWPLNDTRPMYLSDEQRSDCEKAFGKSTATPERFVQCVKECVEVSVSGVTVELNAEDLLALKSRTDGQLEQFDDYMRRLLQRAVQLELMGAL